MDKTVKLFFVYSFDVFDLKSYERAGMLSIFLAVFIYLLTVFIGIYILIPLFDKMKGYDEFFFPIMTILLIIVSYAPASIPKAWLDVTLDKINADHSLSNFDLDKGVLRLLAQFDIEENGFFSAKGYWTLYFKNIEYDEQVDKDDKEGKRKIAMENKYSNVFKKEKHLLPPKDE